MSPERHDTPVALASGLRGLAADGFADFDPRVLPWDAVLAKQPIVGAQLAKRSRSRLVLRVEWNGHVLFVKRAIARTLSHRISALLQGPKTLREWRVAGAFLALGVCVPRPVLWADDGGGVRYLATVAFPDGWRDLHHETRAHGLDAGMLADVARYVRWLHDLPAHHADLRSDHVWLTDAPGDAPLADRFALMDLDGARADGRPVTRRERARALHQLLMSLCRRDLDAGMAAAIVAAYEGQSPTGLQAGDLYHRARAAYLASKD